MKKILIGFIAIGLLTFVGCEKDDDTDTTDSTETSSDEGSTDTSDDTTESTDSSSDKGTDSSTDDDTTDSTDTSSGEVKDADGNVYTSVTIGTQEWMVENLRTTKYSDGTVIPNVTDNTKWGDLETAAWCHYYNDTGHYVATHGKLYNWYAVNTSKLCPKGWHVPKVAEWTALTDYLTADGYSGSEGTALKSTSGWINKDDGTSGNGTDDYGWNALPDGTRFEDGDFYDIGGFGYWWSSSQYSTDNAWYHGLSSYVDNVSSYDSSKRNGFSVRCLRD